MTPTDPTPAPAPPVAHRPPAVDGFAVERELGRGGMGVVYLARQVRLNRPVALKMVLAGGHASAEERARFLAEAELIAKLHHPHVVQVHEFGADADGRPFFALEYLPGGSLADRLRDGPLAPAVAAGLVETLARAVGYAHGLGVIHRDIKPGNVLFDAAAQPKVADFGLAKQAGSASDLTATGAVLGTPSYMPPEQAAGRPPSARRPTCTPSGPCCTSA
ncbi:MAG: serine/threonine protein kinase [Gemmataceae bacterium]|nr:serine/threonine protein kinase [Gemmataceae bacterium]